MKTKMIVACVMLLLGSSAFAQEKKLPGMDTTLKNLDPVKAEKAKALVYNYTRLLFRGNPQDVDSAVALCDFPFAWDKKEIISSAEEFKKMQLKVIGEKGANRPFVVDSVYVKATRHEIIDRIIPVDVYYVVIRMKLVRDGKERIKGALFAVQMSEVPKLVGLSD